MAVPFGLGGDELLRFGDRDPPEQARQAGQPGQFLPAVTAPGQVQTHQGSLGGLGGAQHVDAERGPDSRASRVAGHGANPGDPGATVSARRARAMAVTRSPLSARPGPWPETGRCGFPLPVLRPVPIPALTSHPGLRVHDAAGAGQIVDHGGGQAFRRSVPGRCTDA